MLVCPLWSGSGEVFACVARGACYAAVPHLVQSVLMPQEAMHVFPAAFGSKFVYTALFVAFFMLIPPWTLSTGSSAS